MFGNEMLLNTENIALRSFVYICITREKLAILRQSQPKNGNFVRAYYKYIQNLQTSQGYIFRILQHFANKLCNSSNFKIPQMIPFFPPSSTSSL